MRHVISTKQFLDTTVLERIFSQAEKLERLDKHNELPTALRGKILASLFYEPSTRTRFSFESAIQKLGGSVISTESAKHFSSVTKGEVLGDTIRIIGGYSDVIVLRHSEVGSAQLASEVSDVPIINAGDGIGEHPTQALLDLYTIKKEKGSIDNLTIALVGDLLYGRTIHSLLHLLALYKVKILLVSPKQLALPEKYKKTLTEKGVSWSEHTDLKNICDQVDVLYVTRIQKERFSSMEEYEKLANSYVIDNNYLKTLSLDCIIMHPLPRVNEIAKEVDSDSRAAYFRQARNGLYIRMALLQMIFER